MKKYAVLVAGGTGTRMKSSTPKQFLKINGNPLLYYTIDTFLKAFSDINIIIVLPNEHIQNWRTTINNYFPKTDIQLIQGGDTRFQSVKNGLSLIKEESIIFVHDAVRCLLSKALIIRCYESAVAFGSAIPAINSKDSVRVVENGISKAVNRDTVKLIQTPQTFRSDILLNAFKNEYNTAFTDEASVVEFAGLQVNVMEGEESNIKITHPIDLFIAEKIMSER